LLCGTTSTFACQLSLTHRSIRHASELASVLVAWLALPCDVTHATAPLVQLEQLMAKSQKQGNREAKKPKQVKLAPVVESAGLLAKAGAGPGTNKKRV
jgi:hypothetical protein